MMPKAAFLLKSNTAIKPLLNRWVLWPSLIPPPWASAIVKKIHVPIMESYVANPEFHLNAARDPELLGGPWLDQPISQLDRVQALLKHTITAQAPLVAFARAIKALNGVLHESANGLALD